MSTTLDDAQTTTFVPPPPGFDAVGTTDSIDEDQPSGGFVFMDYEYESVMSEPDPQLLYSERGRSGRDIRHVSTVSKTGLHRIRRDVPTKLRETMGRNHIHVSVYETSLTPNNRIRNAITGLYTPFRVGTVAEDLFFKVCWAMGSDGRRDPINLFFETPAEFEKHFLETLSDDVKQAWTRRCREVEKLFQRTAAPKSEAPMQTLVH